MLMFQGKEIPLPMLNQLTHRRFTDHMGSYCAVGWVLHCAGYFDDYLTPPITSHNESLVWGEFDLDWKRDIKPLDMQIGQAHRCSDQGAVAGIIADAIAVLEAGDQRKAGAS